MVGDAPRIWQRGRFTPDWSPAAAAIACAPPRPTRADAAAPPTMSSTAHSRPAGPLLLSSLVVGLSRDGRFVPRLEFGTEASAMAQLEIYGGAAGTAVGAMLEITDGTNGKLFFTVPLILEATNDRDRFIARGTIPIGALPPGDFVARAIVEQKGQPAGRVLRTIRKR